MKFNTVKMLPGILFMSCLLGTTTMHGMEQIHQPTEQFTSTMQSLIEKIENQGEVIQQLKQKNDDLLLQVNTYKTTIDKQEEVIKDQTEKIQQLTQLNQILKESNQTLAKNAVNNQLTISSLTAQTPKFRNKKSNEQRSFDDITKYHNVTRERIQKRDSGWFADNYQGTGPAQEAERLLYVTRERIQKRDSGWFADNYQGMGPAQEAERLLPMIETPTQS